MTRHEAIADDPHGPQDTGTVTADTHPLACSFNAKWLWPMKAVIAYARLQDPVRFPLGHIGVEPAVEGGVLVSVFSGHAMAFIHDRDGSASESLTLDLPDAAFDLCRPQGPVRMSSCGWEHVFSLPEWTQPGKALFHEAGMMIFPRMAPPGWHADAEEGQDFLPLLFQQTASCCSRLMPGHDYRISRGIPHDWRRLIVNWMAGSFEADHVLFNPNIPALFSGFLDVMNPQSTLSTKHWLRKTGPNVMTVAGHPEFIGFWMPMREDRPGDEPAEFKQLPARFLNEVSGHG
ncbi:hypothetical protein [Martelella endophytica]|uniref:Uncharacterized protein n=1 Tax=Martelella endophytica TaxID=1486262 RepID=A0A0D5LSW8_MAREN|nr:hypothetical protein [Martelella endophytica]AJY46852.1 hypothetical protein TM49_16110 [Martelella endophytica]